MTESTLEGYSRVIKQLGEERERRDTEALAFFESNKEVIFAGICELDNEDLLTTWQEHLNPLSNTRLWLARVEFADRIRKLILDRMLAV